MGSKIFDTEKLYKIIYDMTFDANIYLPSCMLEKIKNSKCEDVIKKEIIKNTYLAQEKKRPLCQDSGQVVVFVEIGQDIQLKGEYIDDVINKAIKDCYIDNFFRKSIVKNALFERENTNSNTPAIIHHKIIKENKIKILLALKGGGSENTAQIKMFNPTTSEDEIKDFVKSVTENAIKYACPPVSVGVGVGGLLETACELSKLALFKGEPYDLDMENVYDARILTTSTHIANMPVCVNINCHSARYKEAEITFENNDFTVIYNNDKANLDDIKINADRKHLNTNNLDDFKNLNEGDKIYLSGTIYTARDMAHKRLFDIIQNKEEIPFDIKNSFIFYAGPAPKKEGEIIGPVGPTTSKRMDKYSKLLYENGVFATIGKGERELNNGLYFTATGGVACLLQDCIKKSEIACFEDLGPEAIYKLEVQDLPLTVNYK